MFGKKVYRSNGFGKTSKQASHVFGKRSKCETSDLSPVGTLASATTLYLSLRGAEAFLWPVEDIPMQVMQSTQYRQAGYEKTVAYQRGAWDGWVSLSHLARHDVDSRDTKVFVFPIGLLSQVLERCHAGGCHVEEVTGLRAKPSHHIQPIKPGVLGGGISLRDYQEKTVDAFVSEDRLERVQDLPSLGLLSDSQAQDCFAGVGELTRMRLPGSGLIWAATGSGKTVSSASIIGRLAVPTLFMVYGNDLVRQTWRNFNEFLGPWLKENGQALGSAMEGEWNPGFVTVAGSSTLAAMLAAPNNAKIRAKKAVEKFIRVGLEAKSSGAVKGESWRTLEELILKSRRWLSASIDRRDQIVDSIREMDLCSIVLESSYVGDLPAEKWFKMLESSVRAMQQYPKKQEAAMQRRQQLLDYLKTVDLLVVDEVHKVAASGAYEVTQRCPAYYRIGMSGTPLDRSDGANLKVLATCGEVGIRITNAQMKQAGVIPDAKIKMVHVPGSVDLGRRPKWSDVYEAGIVRNKWRNRYGAEAIKRVYDQGGKVLTLFKSVEHGKVLGSLLEEMGVEAVVLDGSSTTERRRDCLDLFEEGMLRVIVASAIFGTGINIPQGFDLLLLMGGGKGKRGDERGGIAVLQNLGRGLRGSGSVEVIDFMDSQHGMLVNHSRGRLSIYRDQDCFDVVEVKRDLDLDF